MLSLLQDPRGCLACQVFLEREESLAPRDTVAERGTSERRVGLASRETREREAPKVNAVNGTVMQRRFALGV